MNVQELITDIEILERRGDLSAEISAITIDSRAAASGALFVAVKGFTTDGHQHIAAAIAGGASAILCEVLPDEEHDVPFIRVGNTRECLGRVARTFCGYPDKKLQTIGVTGTNGKTSTASFIQQILGAVGFRSGLIGTIFYDDGNQQKAATHTTPEAHVVYELLADMVENGCTHVVMEVSSHALMLNRVEGLEFDRALFLNFSQDHLDFHKTMDDYFNAKKRLFTEHLRGIGILNADEPQITEIDVAEKRTFSTGRPADVVLDSFLVSMSQTQFTLRQKDEFTTMKTSVIGKYNLSNLLAAISTVLSFDVPMGEIAAAVSALTSVRGRMEKHVVNERHVLIDYAHTPDALESVLKAARTLCEGKLVCVFGCGGDRDKSKRPKMAQAVEKYADLAIVTSDNPRSEQPAEIIEDVTNGFSSPNFIVESDRKSAIFKGLESVSPRDLIVIAGKGHETYQEIQGVRYPFNDAEVIYQWSM